MSQKVKFSSIIKEGICLHRRNLHPPDQGTEMSKLYLGICRLTSRYQTPVTLYSILNSVKSVFLPPLTCPSLSSSHFSFISLPPSLSPFSYTSLFFLHIRIVQNREFYGDIIIVLQSLKIVLASFFFARGLLFVTMSNCCSYYYFKRKTLRIIIVLLKVLPLETREWKTLFQTLQ